MASIIHFFHYYQSFIKIFWFQELPQNKLELYQWSLYQLFNLYYKPVSHDGVILYDRFIQSIFFHFSRYSSFSRLADILRVVFFTRWWVIIAALLWPLVFLCLGIFSHKSYFKFIQYPYYFIQNHKYLRNSIKYNFLELNLLSSMYVCYVYHISGNDDLCIGNKHWFSEFCTKYSIKTINCIKSLKDLNIECNNCQSKEDLEWVIKPSLGGQGKEIFLTKEPQNYLSKVPHIVIQPRMKNHQSIIDVTKNKKTLNTFRVCTFSKDTDLKPFVYMKSVKNENCVVDNVNTNKGNTHTGYRCYTYDMETNLFTQMLQPVEMPLVKSYSSKGAHTFENKFEGFNEFINYLDHDIHHKYLNDIIGIGWDVTKISNGDWIIVECNASMGYYYDKAWYSEKLLEAYVRKISEFKQH